MESGGIWWIFVDLGGFWWMIIIILITMMMIIKINSDFRCFGGVWWSLVDFGGSGSILVDNDNNNHDNDLVDFGGIW